MDTVRAGFAMSGSFCTFSGAMKQLEYLISQGVDVTPIMSQTAFSIDTRFGKAKEIHEKIEDMCKKKVIHTIDQAEPIGPKKLLDVLIIEPCTGNTLGKLANGITDTSVTLSAKSHLRNGRPVLIAVSTNDALGSSGKNIGQLMNYKNIYFVPMKQDDCVNKPNSIVADFDKTYDAMCSALAGKQLQPFYL